MVLAVVIVATGLVLRSDRPEPVRGPVRYVALGDSYSAGEGLGHYDTTDPAAQPCDRSADAFPAVAARSPEGQRLQLVLAACSGAQTGDLYRPLGDPARSQLDALTPDTDLVSLTIGGNDLGFAPVLSDCVVATLDREVVLNEPGCRDRHRTEVRQRLARLAGTATEDRPDDRPDDRRSLATVLADIHTRAPAARIFLIGYPQLFGEAVDDPRLGCRLYSTMVSFPGPFDHRSLPVELWMDADDARWLDAAVRDANETLRAAATAASAAGIPVAYLDVDTPAGSSFAGHRLCDAGESWISPPTPAVDPLRIAASSFHPNASGTAVYADTVLAALSRYGLSSG